MQSQKISIIVPAYNVARYLSDCLDSILSQTYTNIEVIVVNDGSTDETALVLDDYAMKDARIKAIHKENGGVTSARFSGIAVASGEWIGFVDGDDAIDPDMYERLHANALQYGAQISHCGHRLILESGEERCFYNTGRLAEQDTITGLKDLLDGSFIEPGLCNKLFHTSLFHSLLHGGEMDTTIKNNEDLLMNVILFKQAEKAVYEDFCPYRYYSRQGSATRRTLADYKIFDPIRVKERILVIVPSEMEDDAKRAYAMTCINAYNDLLALQSNNIEVLRVNVRKKLIEHYERTTYVSRKYRCMAWLIRYVPWLYRGIYTVYALTLRKNRYE